MKSQSLLLISFAFLLTSCFPDWEPVFPAGEVEGYEPVYIAKEDATDIRLIEPQPIENAGKLYLYGNLLLINEIGKGIHMIDNSNPSNPLPLGFVKVPGSHDMVIKGNIIYANNFSDLVALKIDNQEVSITERITDVVNSNPEHPDVNGFYFECVDNSKGVVVGWKKTFLNNPNCYR